jgi:hypothetical protein
MSRLIALSLLVYSACASSEASTMPPPAKPAPAAAQPASTADDPQALCVQAFTHNRTCTAEYIPALVDTRAKLDLPPGMADMVKQDRAGVIAKANAEWAEDSKDENIARHCTQMTANLPAEALSLMDEVRACQTQTDCTAYVACIEPVEAKLMAHGPARQ